MKRNNILYTEHNLCRSRRNFVGGFADQVRLKDKKRTRIIIKIFRCIRNSLTCISKSRGGNEMAEENTITAMVANAK